MLLHFLFFNILSCYLNYFCNNIKNCFCLQIYAFEESEDGCEPKFKWFRRRRLADKMYEFCSDEEDMENIRPSSKLPR